MKAGRELDALVYEKVFGRSVKWSGEPGIGVPRDPDKDDGGNCPCCGYDGHWDDSEIPYYSEDIMSAWQIVEKLGLCIVPYKDEDEEGVLWQAGQFEGWHTSDGALDGWMGDGNGRQMGMAKTAPLAICLAALALLDVKRED